MSNRNFSAHAHLVIPLPPLRPRRRLGGTGLDPVQEASLVGIVSLAGFWGLAELAFLLFG
ncbi:hypothetical protein JYK14_11010 [Siccirubricoccus sp. KC 17139]|uniref:Uncharacterized protein n=1 Tax=Siccirubricoccus soli TaxID=2899147 RepID=A0ABT1D441_9PROT|nr:hypothetical protein [Siccirubricoccus soli]MCO6416686.1 hypothetical protein [Siccirubricoccus soli]MCP2682821.1 hypothetical protein [Siccirubricoccus soli]